MVAAASREALARLRERLDELIPDASAEDLSTLAGELNAVAALLQGQPRLRRALADPTTDARRRGELATRLLHGKIHETAVGVVATAVSQRWSAPWDLVDSLESVADDVLFAAAERDGSLDDVEDELFRFERILEANGELAALLDEQSVDPARRNGLVDRLLENKAQPITQALVHQAIASTRRRSLVLTIDQLLESAAARRDRSVARVTSAVELTDAQVDRLTTALSAMYGRAMSVRTAVDPAIRGGLVIRVGGEIIDGSVASYLLRARQALAR